MKRIFRRNQIIITTLAVMIAAAGYLNYSSKKEVAGAEVYEAGMMDISDSDILAENQAKSGVDDGSLTEIASLDGDGEEKLPDGNEVAAVPESAEVSGSEAAGEETAAAGIQNPGEAELTGGTGISEYIAGVQLGREQIRAKNKETLMQIINSDQISEEEKQTAIQNLIGLTEVSEKENAAETLLKAKGFVDPVVSITDGKADVVVNAASLTDQEREHYRWYGGCSSGAHLHYGCRAGADRGYREEKDGDRGGRDRDHAAGCGGVMGTWQRMRKRTMQREEKMV